jgi:hypothetical protein
MTNELVDRETHESNNEVHKNTSLNLKFNKLQWFKKNIIKYLF